MVVTVNDIVKHEDDNDKQLRINESELEHRFDDCDEELLQIDDEGAHPQYDPDSNSQLFEESIGSIPRMEAEGRVIDFIEQTTGGK